MRRAIRRSKSGPGALLPAVTRRRDGRAFGRRYGVAVEPPGRVNGTVLAIFCRLVVVGTDGTRLHEELMVAGRELTAAGRSRRLELENDANADIRQAVEAAFDPDACRPAAADVRAEVLDRWAELSPRLSNDIELHADGRLSVCVPKMSSVLSAIPN